MDSGGTNNLELHREIIEMMRQQYQLCSEYRSMIQSYSQMCSNYYSYMHQHSLLVNRMIDNLQYGSREATILPRNSVFPMPTVNSLTPTIRLLSEYARQSRAIPMDNERSLPLPQLRRHSFSRNYASPLRVLPTDIFSISVEPRTNAIQYGATDISNTTYIPGTTTTHTVCPIGLDDFVEGEPVSIIRGCGHTFKRENLERWLMRNTVCPVCRYDIANRQPAVNNENNRDTLEFIFDVSGNFNNENGYENLRQMLYNAFSGVLGSDRGATTRDRNNGRSRYDAEVIVETDSEGSDDL